MTASEGGGDLGCTVLLEEVVGGRLRELITYNNLQFLLCDVSWEYDLCVPGTCHLLLCLPAMMDCYPLEQQVKTTFFYPQLLLVMISYDSDRKASNTKQ